MATSVNIFLLGLFLLVLTYFSHVGSKVLPTKSSDGATKNVTAHYCPQSCTLGNETLCYRVPCPVPPCQDSKQLRPTDCCFSCPSGPNCRAPDGTLVKVNHWKEVNGKNCTCEMYHVDTGCI